MTLASLALGSAYANQPQGIVSLEHRVLPLGPHTRPSEKVLSTPVCAFSSLRPALI